MTDGSAHRPAPETVRRLRATFAAGRARDPVWRRRQLDGIVALLTECEEELAAALHADLRKSPAEAWTTEIGFTIGEAEHAKKKLARWMRPRRAGLPLALQPGSGRIVPEPLGVALIIAPWNYPLQLALSPLIAALAAGNCAVVKPSEIAPHTAAALSKLVPSFLDPDAVAVVEGGVPATTGLLEERWDKIFYTGNGKVGRIVMAAAAKHLTPVTLELGGKSPCLVDRSADIAAAGRRIAWGKFLNAGQTCVAPDYVLVAREREAALVDAIGQAVRDMFGDDPARSEDYARIVSNRHFDRLRGLLGNGAPALGGEVDATDRYIAPTVLRGVGPDHPAMQEEIFGPILPVIPVDDMREAIAYVTARDKPLALYLFSRDADIQRRVLAGTSSGGAAINDTILQLAAPSLPFGGVGESGMGAYHGEHGFRAFSHMRAVLRKPVWPDPPLRYPPFTAGKMRWIRRLM